MFIDARVCINNKHSIASSQDVWENWAAAAAAKRRSPPSSGCPPQHIPHLVDARSIFFFFLFRNNIPGATLTSCFLSSASAAAPTWAPIFDWRDRKISGAQQQQKTRESKSIFCSKQICILITKQKTIYIDRSRCWGPPPPLNFGPLSNFSWTAKEIDQAL